MLILAFESSAKAASVALLREDILLGEYYQNCGQTHSRTLLKMAEDLMENCGVSAADITAVACSAGPGSFTGVRIGMAAAKGFSWAKELPCVGVSTLEAMAHQAGAFNGLVVCAMDARRDQIYHAVFSCEGGELRRIREDCAVSLEEAAEMLKNEKKEKIIVGDGAVLCYNVLQKFVPSCILASEQLRHQRASGVALAARQLLLRGETGDAAALAPNYLRLSQAERERNERLTKSKGE